MHADHGAHENPLRVLLVDDDPEFSVLLIRWLRRAGHAVVTAADGVSAIRSAVNEVPDLVLRRSVSSWSI